MLERGSTLADALRRRGRERRSRHVRGHGRRGGGAGTGGEESKDDKGTETDEAPTKSTALDFSAMSVKALKAYIVAHGGAVDGHIAEKSELVSLARSRPHVIVPEGYVWSVERSMYYSEASDLCYEPAKNLFTDGADAWWTSRRTARIRGVARLVEELY